MKEGHRAAAAGSGGASVRRGGARVVERVCRYGAECRHFAAGTCYFSHVPDGGPGGYCWHFANGKCKFGEKCGRRHWEEPKRPEMGGRQCVVCAPAQADRPGLAPVEAAEAAMVESRKESTGVATAMGARTWHRKRFAACPHSGRRRCVTASRWITSCSSSTTTRPSSS